MESEKVKTENHLEIGSVETQYVLVIALVVILVIAYFRSWCLFVDRLISPIFFWLTKLSSPSGQNVSILKKCPSLQSLGKKALKELSLPKLSIPEISDELLLQIIIGLVTIVVVVTISEIVYRILESTKRGPEKSEQRPKTPQGGIFGGLGRKKKVPITDLELSVAHPRLLSKRFSSTFRVVIYPPPKQEEAYQGLLRNIQSPKIERVEKTELKAGFAVVIKLFSHDIEFSEEVVKILEAKINEASFTGKPKDNCYPGEHKVRLSIRNKESGHEYLSDTFQVKVVDFAFDHISRPFLSKLISSILGTIAAITYILTFLGQMDATFGFASGTAATAVAGFVFGRFLTMYQRPNAMGSVSSKYP
jgi:hypothetical protein